MKNLIYILFLTAVPLAMAGDDAHPRLNATLVDDQSYDEVHTYRFQSTGKTSFRFTDEYSQDVYNNGKPIKYKKSANFDFEKIVYNGEDRSVDAGSLIPMLDQICSYDFTRTEIKDGKLYLETYSVQPRGRKSCVGQKKATEILNTKGADFKSVQVFNIDATGKLSLIPPAPLSLDSQGFVVDSRGPVGMSRKKAAKACPQGTRLPTARELAELAQSKGAKGILELSQINGAPPKGYFLVKAQDPSGKMDEFYFSQAGYAGGLSTDDSIFSSSMDARGTPMVGGYTTPVAMVRGHMSTELNWGHVWCKSNGSAPNDSAGSGQNAN